eukprot:2845613-Alexandrium_andersonii.AAC.1
MFATHAQSLRRTFATRRQMLATPACDTQANIYNKGLNKGLARARVANKCLRQPAAFSRAGSRKRERAGQGPARAAGIAIRSTVTHVDGRRIDEGSGWP